MKRPRFGRAAIIRLRSAATGACLALLVAGASYCALRAAYDHPLQKQLFRLNYASEGEVLIHGIGAWSAKASYRMPLAAIVAALLQYHCGISPPVLNALDWSLVVILIFALGCLLHPWGGLLSSAAAVVTLSCVGDYTFYPDSGFVLLVLLAACVLAWRAQEPSLARSLLLAAVIGVTVLYRSPLAFFPPVLALHEWAVFHRFSLRSYWRHLLILCLVPYLLLLPWIALNWTIHHRLILFEHGAADSNIVTGALGLVQNIDGDFRALVDEPPGAGGTVLGWAARQAVRHPLRYAGAYVRRFAYVFSLRPVLFLFAAVSLWLFRKRRDFQQLGLLSAYFLLVHCFMTVEERYFWPLWPLLSVLAAAVIVAFQARERPRTDSIEWRLSSLVVKGAVGVVAVLYLFTSWAVGSYAGTARLGQGGAEENLSEALRSYPHDAWLLFERGRERLSRGEDAGAAQDFAMAAELEPDNPESRLRLAGALAVLGKPALLLRWRSQPQPTSDELGLRRDADILKACAYIRLGRAGKAAALLNAALETDKSVNIHVRGPRGAPESQALEKLRLSERSFVNRCFGLLGDRPAGERLALSEELVKLVPRAVQVWTERSDAQRRLGHERLALASLAKAAALNPDDDERRRIAALYGRLNDYRRALSLLEPLLERRPQDAGPWIERAQFAAGLKDRGLALESLAKAAGSNPDDGQRRRIAALYGQLGEYRLALSLLEPSLARGPQDAGLWIERSELAAELKDRGMALESLAKAEGLNPGLEQSRLLALDFQKLGEYSRALAILGRLTREHPALAPLYSDKGLCNYLNGSSDAAIEDLKAAIKLGPGLYPAYLTLGAIYTAQRRPDEAVRLYDRALSMKPLKINDPLRDAVLKARRELSSKTSPAR
ncbi:MAG: tetratricopeptide repeat protein [Elusimicrobia bacterium]|nr:tetratricopeptide repeat protein [Elusimicrobiota bacterium]